MSDELMVRHSDTWVFNIAPQNWDACASGPTDAALHGEEHVGQPWHGVRSAGEDGPDIKPGDLVLARETSNDGRNPNFGVKGVWEFVDARRVTDQSMVPWTDADYEWVLYCRPVERELETIYTEDFEELSFTSNTLQGAIKSLEPSDKRDYLQTIAGTVPLSTAAQDRFNAALGDDVTDTDSSRTPNEQPRRGAQTVIPEFDLGDREPAVWIEKTYIEDRPYKQSGKYRLGNAIYSPSQGKAGQDRYSTMREADVGDIICHLDQDHGEIVGASRIASELDTSFEGLPDFDWTEEQRDDGGYLRWLTDYQEFETPLDIHTSVFENDRYETFLTELTEQYKHLPYTKRLGLSQGTYLARCPSELQSVLAVEHDELKTYFDDANVTYPPIDSLLEATGAGPQGGTAEGEPVTDFESIKAATTTVLDRLQDSQYSNVIAEHYSLDTIKAWSQALHGFQPDSFIPPADDETLRAFESALDTHRDQLNAIATDLRIGTLNTASPAEVVFLAMVRDCQQTLRDQDRISFALNANQAKLNALQNRAYHTLTHTTHPLVPALADGSTRVYTHAAPITYWLTALRYRAIGFLEEQRERWQSLTEGDIILFYVRDQPVREDVDTATDYCLGAGIVGNQFEAGGPWWADTDTANHAFPLRVAFDRFYGVPSIANVGDPVAATGPASQVEATAAAIAAGGIPKEDLNAASQAAADTDFDPPQGAAELEWTDGIGQREAVMDVVAKGVTELSSIAVHRDFTGRIPASAFSDLHFPDHAGVASADELAKQLTAALRSGKHIILTGPPGTGKTAVADRVVDHLETAYPYLYSGGELTTATADWSTFDTVGGYMPAPDAEGDALGFRPGLVLNRFKHPDRGVTHNEPLVIDELNRANIDKAFGQLFTTLSGQSVTLPYRQDANATTEITLTTAQEAATPTLSSEYVVPESWRILATMNTFDKTSLYELSYAFLRRFATIRIGVPEIPPGDADKEALLAGYTAPSVWDLEIEPNTIRHVASLWRATNTAVPERSIGPAITKDILTYLSNHEQGGTSQREQFTEAVVSFIFPQLEGVPGREEIIMNIAALDIIETDQLARAARDMLGVTALETPEE